MTLKAIGIQILDWLTFGQPGDPVFMTTGDIEAFLLLFFNNFLNLSFTYELLVNVVGYDALFVTAKILPGMGVSVFVGSIFYWWQARRKSKLEKRDDICALPFGISTPSLFAFVSFILLPEKQAGGDPFAAVIFSTFWCGIIEAATVFYGFAVRKGIPNTALISSLTGIAIALIAAGNFYQIFQYPALSIIPLLLFLFATASRVEIKSSRFKWLFLPWGVVVLTVGVIIAWTLVALKSDEISFPKTKSQFGFYYPYPSFDALFKGFRNGIHYAAVMAPLAVINGIGSLQNLVSAKNKGDDFDNTSSLIVNGLASSVGACFGAAFPNSIFIGHPVNKDLGARSGYMLLNGVAVLIVTSFGLVQVVLKFLPISAFLPILAFIGLQMTAEGFFSDDEKGSESECPRRHHLAAAVGVVPALANLTVAAVTNALQVANVSWKDVFDKFSRGGFYLGGAIALSQGFLLSSCLLAAVVVHWIDRQYLRSAVCLLILSILSWIGLIHAYELTPNGPVNIFVGQKGTIVAAPGFALSYALFAFFMLICEFLSRHLGVWKQGELKMEDGQLQWTYGPGVATADNNKGSPDEEEEDVDYTKSEGDPYGDYHQSINSRTSAGESEERMTLL